MLINIEVTDETDLKTLNMATMPLESLSINCGLTIDYRSGASESTLSLADICVAERKQVVLLDTPIMCIASAQKVHAWLDRLQTGHTVAGIFCSPVKEREAPVWELAEDSLGTILPAEHEFHAAASPDCTAALRPVLESSKDLIDLAEGELHLPSATWSNFENRATTSVPESACSDASKKTCLLKRSIC